MNFKPLLLSEVQKYINSNLNTDVRQHVLTKNPFPEIDFTIIINQVKAKQSSKEKLPLWYKKLKINYEIFNTPFVFGFTLICTK